MAISIKEVKEKYKEKLETEREKFGTLKKDLESK